MDTPTPTPTPTTDPTPTYRALAGELVADCLALFRAVHDARPDVSRFGSSSLVATFDLDARRVHVGLRVSPDRVAVIESINVDPDEPALFGASDLPIMVPASGVSH